MNKINIRRLISKPKYPTDNKNYVGIELEFGSNLSRKSITDLLIKYNLQWCANLGYDASIELSKTTGKILRYEPFYNVFIQSYSQRPVYKKISIGNEAYELRLLIKEKDLFKTSKNLTALLNDKKCDFKINDSCGFHIHLDMRNRDVDKCFKSLFNCQDVLYNTVDKSRRKRNDFCKKIRTIKKKSSKYDGISKHRYSDLGTIEVRLHEGCVDGKEIYNWIKTLIQVTDAHYTKKQSLKSLKKTLPKRMYDYINERTKRSKAVKTKTNSAA